MPADTTLPTDPREQVALGCQVLAVAGQSDLIWGHVGVCDPDGRGAWIKARGLGFGEVTPHDVVLVDRAGGRLDGDGGVHLEYPIHTEILAARAGTGCVVHSHAESVVAFAATGMALRAIGHEGTLFTPPAVARYTDTGDLIRTPEMGADVAAALGDRNALLIPHHGFVTAGPDLPTAVMTAVLLEKACRMQLTVAAAGGDYTWSDDDESLAKRDRCYDRRQLGLAWDYLVRQLPPG